MKNLNSFYRTQVTPTNKSCELEIYRNSEIQKEVKINNFCQTQNNSNKNDMESICSMAKCNDMSPENLDTKFNFMDNQSIDEKYYHVRDEKPAALHMSVLKRTEIISKYVQQKQKNMDLKKWHQKRSSQDNMLGGINGKSLTFSNENISIQQNILKKNNNNLDHWKFNTWNSVLHSEASQREKNSSRFVKGKKPFLRHQQVQVQNIKNPTILLKKNYSYDIEKVEVDNHSAKKVEVDKHSAKKVEVDKHSAKTDDVSQNLVHFNKKNLNLKLNPLKERNIKTSQGNSPKHINIINNMSADRQFYPKKEFKLTKQSLISKDTNKRPKESKKDKVSDTLNSRMRFLEPNNRTSTINQFSNGEEDDDGINSWKSCKSEPSEYAEHNNLLKKFDNMNLNNNVEKENLIVKQRLDTSAENLLTSMNISKASITNSRPHTTKKNSEKTILQKLIKSKKLNNLPLNKAKNSYCSNLADINVYNQINKDFEYVNVCDYKIQPKKYNQKRSSNMVLESSVLTNSNIISKIQTKKFNNKNYGTNHNEKSKEKQNKEKVVSNELQKSELLQTNLSLYDTLGIKDYNAKENQNYEDDLNFGDNNLKKNEINQDVSVLDKKTSPFNYKKEQKNDQLYLKKNKANEYNNFYKNCIDSIYKEKEKLSSRRRYEDNINNLVMTGVNFRGKSRSNQYKSKHQTFLRNNQLKPKVLSLSVDHVLNSVPYK